MYRRNSSVLHEYRILQPAHVLLIRWRRLLSLCRQLHVERWEGWGGRLKRSISKPGKWEEAVEAEHTHTQLGLQWLERGQVRVLGWSSHRLQ